MAAHCGFRRRRHRGGNGKSCGVWYSGAGIGLQAGEGAEAARDHLHREERASFDRGHARIAHLTAVVLSPPDLMHLAAGAGYQSVGLRLFAVTPDSPGYPLMDDPAAMSATKAPSRTDGPPHRETVLNWHSSSHSPHQSWCNP